MALTEPYSGSFSVSTTELSFVSGTSALQEVTDDGIYQLFLDLNTVANGDVFEVRVYEKVRSSSTKRVAHHFVIADAQGTDGAIAVTPPLQLMHGWDMTIDRTAGADRTIEYSIRKVA
jgi:hypothetical protein